MHTGNYNNTVLQHLDDETIKRLELRPVALAPKMSLEKPGESIRKLFFLESGTCSMTTVFASGEQVEVAMFGYEAVVGLSGLMGTKRSLNHVFMQLGGHGYSATLECAKTEFKRHGTFHHLTLHYVQAQLTISNQSTACNAVHSHEQRLARWLLMCSDRARLERLELSQELISEMLGSTRSTISLAAGVLKQKGLIDYSRGSIQILDVRGLEDHACECYTVVKHHLSSLRDFDAGFSD